MTYLQLVSLEDPNHVQNFDPAEILYIGNCRDEKGEIYFVIYLKNTENIIYNIRKWVLNFTEREG